MRQRKRLVDADGNRNIVDKPPKLIRIVDREIDHVCPRCQILAVKLIQYQDGGEILTPRPGIVLDRRAEQAVRAKCSCGLVIVLLKGGL